MSGEMSALAVLVLVLMLAIAIALIAVVTREHVKLVRSVHTSQTQLLGIIEKQNALIMSRDPYTYQAIRAVDTYAGGYDDDSIKPDVEEHTDGHRAADDFPEDDPGIEGDAFINGRVFA